MTTDTLLPATQTPVQLTTADGRIGPGRVAAAEGRRVTLAGVELPTARTGDPVTLRWSAGPRGRYVQAATVVASSGSERTVELAGTPQVEQLRRFVRGGGGETVRLRRYESSNAAQFDGLVLDIGEGSVRARCTGLRAAEGDPLWAEIYLDDHMVEVLGTVLSTEPLPDGSTVDLVIVFEPVEQVAQLIRRYVLAQQVRARRATG